MKTSPATLESILAGSSSLSADLQTLFRAARAATVALDKQMSRLGQSLSATASPVPEDDIVVLRQKYSTVNGYIQAGDRWARWVGQQTAMVVERQPRPDAFELLRKIRWVLDQVNRPEPSRELIQADLQGATSTLGAVYRQACQAFTRLGEEAWKQAEAICPTFNDAQMVTTLVTAMHASVECVNLALVPAKRLRDDLTQRLRVLGSGIQATTVPAQVQPAYQFQRLGETWTVRYAKEQGQFRNRKGMEYIARLLASPGKSVSVLDLANPDTQRTKAGRSVIGQAGLDGGTDEEPAGGQASFQPVIDPKAQRDTKQRLQELAQDIAKARKDNDQAAVEAAQTEFYQLEAYLKTATGLGGKARPLKTGGPTEKAREAVKRALNRAYKMLEKAKPPLTTLVAHLRSTIQVKGDCYTYSADPICTPKWFL